MFLQWLRIVTIVVILKILSIQLRIQVWSELPVRTWSLVRKSILGYSDKNIWEYREALPFMYKLARQLRLRFYAWNENLSSTSTNGYTYIDLAIYRSVRKVVQDSTSTRFDLVAKKLNTAKKNTLN